MLIGRNNVYTDVAASIKQHLSIARYKLQAYLIQKVLASYIFNASLDCAFSKAL